MDSPGQRQDAVSSLIKVLRKVTRIVQIAPFAYLLLSAICLLGECLMPDWMLRVAENLLSTPAYAVVGMLLVGRWLKLCSWFRAACLLPCTAKVEGYIDSFVYTFSQNEVVLINITLGILFLLFIYSAFRHFFHAATEK